MQEAINVIEEQIKKLRERIQNLEVARDLLKDEKDKEPFNGF